MSCEPTTQTRIEVEHSRLITKQERVGIVGARGFVGAELLELIESHPNLTLAFASSRRHRGEPIAAHAKASFDGSCFEHLEAEEISDRQADVVVLAVPDAASSSFVEATERGAHQPSVLLDLSSDHRFDSEWTYGLPEHNGAAIRDASKISNPGCYATAAQLALRPLLPLLAQTAHCFGVSGYSGAGAAPSARNSEESLSNGVLPYALTNHTHEREIARHTGLDGGLGVRFSPNIASFFRGITLSVQATLQVESSAEALCELYAQFYCDSPLVSIRAEHIPEIRDIVGRDGAEIGGMSVNPERPNEVAMVCTIDNLRKGAATQAIQNINLALGYDKLDGLNAMNTEIGS